MAMNDPSAPMRARMTDFVNTLQASIVDALEAADPSAPPFKRDVWQRPQGGSGCSCVFSVPFSSSSTSPAFSSSSSPAFSPSDSAASKEEEQKPWESESILEKAGVNVSVVHGQLPPAAIKQMAADHATIERVFDPEKHPQGLPFFAAGISLVIHPRNPHAPTVHANYRYFELAHPIPDSTSTSTSTTTSTPASAATTTSTPTGAETQLPLAWWFGGGADLTPSYLYPSDATHFHQTLKTACDAHGAALYPALKPWCDEYFAIPHRGETRGVGGIFFDDLCEGVHARIPSSCEPSASSCDFGGGGKEKEGTDTKKDTATATTTATKARPQTPFEIFSFIRTLGTSFLPSYLPLLKHRAHQPYTSTQRRWQLLRRGRYVEFNLIYDRGTKFGLLTPGARVESVLMSLPEVARWEYGCELEAEEGTEEKRLVEVLRCPKAWVEA